MPRFVEARFRAYLRCGILAHGFARARCSGCAHDFLVALSCKGRGVFPYRNAWRMAAAATHLTDHVIPRVPVRQWVLSVPKPSAALSVALTRPLGKQECHQGGR